MIKINLPISNSMKQRGFTLIELLVVIAIIGLLSSVVLASLNGARMKAKDAAIKQSLREMQKVIELSMSNGNKNNYNDTGLWVGGYVNKDCSNLGGDMAAEAQKICAAIYKIGVGDLGDLGHSNEFMMGIREYTDNATWLPSKGPRYDLYGITVRLNSGRNYCFSNAGIYEGTSLWGGSRPCFYYLTP